MICLSLELEWTVLKLYPLIVSLVGFHSLVVFLAAGYQISQVQLATSHPG